MNLITVVLLLCVAFWCWSGCAREQMRQPADAPARKPDLSEDEFKARRARLVAEQIRARGIRDEAVLKALTKVPRHRFVTAAKAEQAYNDHPLPIGAGQTISQPFIVAYMTEAAQIRAHEKVLEIGTGSGYQAAILGELAKEVYTIEIVPELAAGASRVLAELGYRNVHVKTGNGYLGWPEQAPFDAIVVTAAPAEIPPALLEQLAVNGKMVIPVGDLYQEIIVVTKTKDGVVEKRTLPVRFVPMIGNPKR